MSDDYGQPLYYDEMDGAGLGRGYLGHPLEPDPSLSAIITANDGGTGSPAPYVYPRDFSTASPWSTSAPRPNRWRLAARTGTCPASPISW